MKEPRRTLATNRQRRLVLSAVLAALAFAAVRAAPADPPPATPPPAPTAPSATAAAAPPLTAEQQKRLGELAQQLQQAFAAKNYADAKPLLDELLRLQPDSPYHWYNLACVHSRLGNKDDAIRSLETAAAKGWVNFAHLEHDADLDAIRDEAGYRALLARKDELQKERARKIYAELTRQFGDGCLYHIDHEHRLVFATTVDQRTLDELRATLSGVADALGRELFTHPPERYVTVIIPKVWRGGVIGGFYNSAEALLQAKGFGGTIIHEFVHALHDGDASSCGQEHPIWVKEGLATLFEDAVLTDGRLVPEHNHRLNAILLRAQVNRHLPWQKFLSLTPADFMRQPANNYAQARYLFFYLFARGKLGAWYRNYGETFPQDATGAQAWEKTFGQPLAEIEKDWVAWVLTLSALPTRIQEGDASLGLSVTPANDGLVVAALLPDGGAAKAGLQVQDVIVRVENQRVGEVQDLLKLLPKRQVGDRLQVEYRRGTEYLKATVELTPAPSPFGALPRPPPAAGATPR